MCTILSINLSLLCWHDENMSISKNSAGHAGPICYSTAARWPAPRKHEACSGAARLWAQHDCTTARPNPAILTNTVTHDRTTASSTWRRAARLHSRPLTAAAPNAGQPHPAGDGSSRPRRRRRRCLVATSHPGHPSAPTAVPIRSESRRHLPNFTRHCSRGCLYHRHRKRCARCPRADHRSCEHRQLLQAASPAYRPHHPPHYTTRPQHAHPSCPSPTLQRWHRLSVQGSAGRFCSKKLTARAEDRRNAHPAGCFRCVWTPRPRARGGCTHTHIAASRAAAGSRPACPPDQPSAGQR